MKTILFMLLAIGLVVTTSCVTQDKCNQKFPPKEVTTKTDSIYIHDSVLVYVTPEGRDTFSMNCTENGIYRFNQGGTKITVKVDNGEISVSVFNPERKSVYKNKIMYVNKRIVITKTYTIEKRPKEKKGALFRWDRLFYALALFGFGAYVGIKIAK